ncbi:MAG: DUF2589 domain-containing protein [Oscillospiraceae bacterium]|nr:DUF2589 domain-containing protein [Oscillospiraceae bacterium]
MAIANQFSGLDMKNLIGGPLSAAADASLQLAQSTADFINNVGFDKDGKVRNVDFGYEKKISNDDGTTDLQEMKVQVPLLSVIPIPNLQIDEVNVTFDMEVKESEQSESSTDASASLSGSGSIFGFKVSISGSVSTHSSNTRSSDNSAKYHVDVAATNHGTPEGLARILDIVAANVSPSLVSSKAVDEYGNPVSGDDKTRNDKIKELKAKQKQLNIALSAAEGRYNNSLTLLKREIKNRENTNEALIQSMITKLDPDKDEAKLTNYSEIQTTVRNSWEDAYKRASDLVQIVSSSNPGKDCKLTSYVKLFTVKEDADKPEPYVDADGDTMETAFKNAIDSFNDYSDIQAKLAENENDIHDQLTKPAKDPNKEQPQPQ